MTPGQARMALGGFFLLAIGVTTNALYLQGAVSGTAEKKASSTTIRPDPQPPPSASKMAKTAKTPVKSPEKTDKAPEKTASDAPGSPAESEAKAAPKSPPSVKVRMVRLATVGDSEETDVDTVRAVQEELNRMGYGPIEPDGVMRQPTRAAIMAFEHDNRLGLTGEASQALLKTLVFGASTESSDGGSSEVLSPHAEALIKQVQQSLITRGYKAGTVDGQMSTETIAAIRTFETDEGLVPKGRICVEVLERLQTGISKGGKHPEEGEGG